MNLLKTRHVGELVADKKNIIEVEKQAPIQEALRLMKENGIMTLPVYNATNHQYEGIIDLFDIMTLVAFGNFATVNPKEEYFKEFQFSSFRVFNLLNSVSKTHNVVALEGSETLQLAMKQLVDTQRILVHQPDDSTRKPVYRLLTQTDVVRFLYNNISSFKDIGSKPIIELEPTKTRHRADLTSTSEKEKTIEGFRKMWRENVHALPVLNEKGEIVATLSSSDLKELTPQKLQTVLFQPLEFLQAIHGGVKPAKPITCYQTDILEDVMLKALTAKVHRVWIVDSAQKPVGVLSYSDIINAFL